jgi:hypothetical protein
VSRKLISATHRARLPAKERKRKIKHITQIQVRVPLWLSRKMETTTFIKNYIIDEKKIMKLRMAAIFAPALSASVPS